MYEYVKQTEEHGVKTPLKYDGLCRSWKRTVNGRPASDMGQILMVKNRLQPHIVAHECMHATFEFMKRKRLKMPDRLLECTSEEIVAHAVGDMTGQIFTKLAKSKHDFKFY